MHGITGKNRRGVGENAHVTKEDDAVTAEQALSLTPPPENPGEPLINPVASTARARRPPQQSLSITS
jgi:hypothetical protein